MNKRTIITQCGIIYNYNAMEVCPPSCSGEEGETYCLMRLGMASPLEDQGRICSPEAVEKLY